jgi:AcrR family transcriptional regulator
MGQSSFAAIDRRALQDSSADMQVWSGPMGRPKALGRPVAADGEETRKRILAAAVQQLGEHGYGKTTLASIAAGAGLTSGAVYHYFDSKKRLVAALASDVARQVDENFQAILVKYDTFAERCAALLNDSRRAAPGTDQLSAFVVSMLNDGPRYPELRSAYRKVSAVHDGFHLKIVREAIARSELRADIDERSITDLLSALTYGMGLLSSKVSMERHQAAGQRLTELIEGMRPPRPRPKRSAQSTT